MLKNKYFNAKYEIETEEAGLKRKTRPQSETVVCVRETRELSNQFGRDFISAFLMMPGVSQAMNIVTVFSRS